VTKFNCAKQTFDAINDFQPGRRSSRQDKSETGAASSLLDGFVQLLLRTRGQISQSPNCLRRTFFFSIIPASSPQKLFQQTHQRNDLGFGRCQFSAEKA